MCVSISSRAPATKIASVFGSGVCQRQRRCHMSLVPSKRFAKTVVQVAQLFTTKEKQICDNILFKWHS